MGRAQTQPVPRAETPATSSAGAAMLVAAHPRDVATLISPELRGSPLVVVCLARGTESDRDGMCQALARWSGAAAGGWHEERARRGADVGLPGVRMVLDAAVSCEAWLLDGAGSGRTACVAALRALCAEATPVLLRTHDPDPAPAAAEESEERGMAARRAIAAARRHQEDTGRPLFVECVRAGNREIPNSAAAQRYPRPDNWLVLGGDGRLSAYLPTAAGIARWHEERPGGTRWLGPQVLEGPALMPALTLLQGPDRYVNLLALRRTARKEGDGANVAVVCATQYQTGRALANWHSFGSPNANNWQKARQMGVPAAAYDDGGIRVFVRNVGHSISTRRQGPNGRMSVWEHLRGVRVSDEIKVATAADGTVEVYARARDTAAALRWHRAAKEGDWHEEDRLPISPIAGTLSVSADGGWSGAAAVHFDNAPGGEFCVWQGPDPAAGLGAGGYHLGASPARGGTSVASGVDVGGWTCTVLARAAADGTPHLAAYAEGRPDAGVWWEPLPHRSLVPPAVVADAFGRAVVGIVGPDGRLRIARHDPAGTGLRFGPFDVV